MKKKFGILSALPANSNHLIMTRFKLNPCLVKAVWLKALAARKWPQLLLHVALSLLADQSTPMAQAQRSSRGTAVGV